jgi:hypothetical protein
MFNALKIGRAKIHFAASVRRMHMLLALPAPQVGYLDALG